jgi:hypothetical protein
LPIFNLESIPTEVDTTISAYVDSGVQLALVLATGSGVRIHYTDYDTTFRTEEEIGRYIEYVKFVMAESRGRIKYYEILNEPGYISVETYANLIRAVVPVIREGDPNARITIGAIPGSWENGYPGYGEYQRFELYLDYLNQLIRSGVAASVDGISWHPLYDNIPADPYYQNYPQMVRGIQDLAASQGFTGEYFADEILWQTVDEPDWDNGPPVNERMAAKYYLRAITEHRGLGLNVTINTFFIEPGQEGIRGDGLAAIRDLNNTLAGAEPAEFPVSVASEAPNVRQYAFSLPNGDKLVALWTNDGAVEDDPGVSSRISIPGYSASAVAGIDVLNGFQQDLVSSNEDQDLVINGLLLKDYPIFIRLAP